MREDAARLAPTMMPRSSLESVEQWGHWTDPPEGFGKGCEAEFIDRGDRDLGKKQT